MPISTKLLDQVAALDAEISQAQAAINEARTLRSTDPYFWNGLDLAQNRLDGQRKKIEIIRRFFKH